MTRKTQTDCCRKTSHCANAWHGDCQQNTWTVRGTLMRRAVPLQACRIKCLSLKAVWLLLGFPTAAFCDWREIMERSTYRGRHTVSTRAIIYLLCFFLREKSNLATIRTSQHSVCQINFTLHQFLFLHRRFSCGCQYMRLLHSRCNWKACCMLWCFHSCHCMEPRNICLSYIYHYITVSDKKTVKMTGFGSSSF